MTNRDSCPICDSPARLICKCPRRDSECAFGHRWHWCLIHDVKIIAPGLHTVTGCSCPKEDPTHPLLGDPE